jgi:HAD superfamily hydrolase (TIGR01509 family)
MRIRGVFFDLHGTLLVFDDPDAAWNAWASGFLGQCEECGLALPARVCLTITRDFFERPRPAPASEGLTLYERRVLVFLRQAGLEPGLDAVRAVADRSAGSWFDRARLDPDAIPVLRRLRETMRTALVSNFDHPQLLHERLAALGLAPHFESVVVSGDVGVEKPDPAIFAPALRATGLLPSEVRFVGDSPEDVAGARAAGIHPVLIDRTGRSRAAPNGVPIIRSLRELLAPRQ